jgi:hypothetical protein
LAACRSRHPLNAPSGCASGFRERHSAQQLARYSAARAPFLGFDELKNQWSWAGFTTRNLRSCQHAARLAALAYNWWTLYHRLLQPGQHHEAVTTRPRLLCGAARQTEHAGQRRLDVRLSHAEAPALQKLIRQVSMWLQALLRNAQQWTAPQRWGQIVTRILRENFGPAPPLSLPQG